MAVKVLIVDDEERERIVLRYVIEQIKDAEVVGEAAHGLEALMLVHEKKTDVVFLDIGMPEMNGIETAYKLLELKEPPLIAFITVRNDMAVEAFEMGALDYIIKPIEQKRMEKTIERVRWHMRHLEALEELVGSRLRNYMDYMVHHYRNHELFSNRLPIKEKGKITLVNHEDIVYCESQGKKVYIFTKEGEGYLSNYTLSELELKLDPINFMRAHQAFIVNLNYIKEIINFGEGSYILHLNNGNKNIILSRSRAKMLRQKMGIQ